MTGIQIIYILAAALTASFLYVILRYFPKFEINNLHGLTANYLTAAFTSWMIGGRMIPSAHQLINFLPPSTVIGLLFIAVFYTAALTTQKCGVAITSIAGKMSMVIPITFGVFVFGDQLTGLKIAGILVALAAVFFSGTTKGSDLHISKFWYLPLLLFMGSGMVDTCIKIVQQFFMDEGSYHLHVSMMFAFAGIIGTLLSLKNFLIKKVKVEIQSISGGIILGVVNYFSLDFLIRCLALPGASTALTFALINLLVVVFSALFGFFLFKEQPTGSNLIGLSLALVAITLLYL